MLGWSLFSDVDLCDRIQEHWTATRKRINERGPALDARFITTLYRHFKEGGEILAVHPDAALILKPNNRLHWSTFIPSQACVGASMVNPELEQKALQQLLRELTRCLPGLCLKVSMLKQDPQTSQFALNLSGENFSETRYGTTTNVEFPTSFSDYWESRSSKIKQDIRRVSRKREKRGVEHVELRECRTPESVLAGLQEYARIESSGWKQREGTAISLESQQGRFYRDLLEVYAKDNDAIVYQLCFDESVVASLLTIICNRIQIVLKTTFDESFSDCGPGRLIDYLMYQSVAADPSIDRIENYTSASSPDMKWATGSRDIVHVEYYRSRSTRMLEGLFNRLRSSAS